MDKKHYLCTSKESNNAITIKPYCNTDKQLHMTYNEKKTNRTFKSEQHALMTAAIAQLKYTTEGFSTSSQNLPKGRFEGQNYARFEVAVYHKYGEDLQIVDYLMPSYIETRDYEDNDGGEGVRCTTLGYMYEY